MMTDFLLFAAVIVIAAFFWQLRQMAELSRVFANRECQKQKVQLLAIAMESARPSIGGSSGLTWRAKYLLEFSTDGINQYQAHIWMQGKTVQKVQWPIFPEPEWLEAPEARGSVGGSCGARGSCNSGKCK
ncbi:DUF3301 domain-containing protein [Shewanella sp. D64]|uniref:DUF3301 domain-containing protein n=1 Tax=unclassified Shewanella TaxID=196818 RepID=UPI0022BA71A8|nr:MULTISPECIES: DUF3301 domain-containing protein [unclassified Shewanella]MEC4727036.1 DUF3301 domain-containing protein [Shewanella sp. D64]MEC4737775.1 DUF3301 domain-containing protein [Shewanella sp. E94]WBJ93966.1 DUF3301 domain-containing protein [Shewanella sp. MTB7]